MADDRAGNSSTAKRGPRMLRFRDLSLFWKVLVPFLTLLLFVGAGGLFLIVRDLSSRAETALGQDLSRAALDVRSYVRDRELYLIESVNFAANVQGMADAIRRRDEAAVTRLARSAFALKPDLDVLIVTDRSGDTLAQLGGAAPPSVRRNWRRLPFVDEVLHESAGRKSSGFLDLAGRQLLVIAAPVCSIGSGCFTIGSAIAGVDIDKLAAGAVGEGPPTGTSAQTGSRAVAIFDTAGTRLAAAGSPNLTPANPPVAEDSKLVRRTTTVGSEKVGTLYVPFDVQGRRAGTLAVTLPSGPAYSAVRGAALRLGGLALGAMAGIVVIGAMLSRYIMRQVTRLVDTNRALGGGDLSARAPVLGRDELGELAAGVNQMAEQLQASYETLESRVEQRTEEVRRLLEERTEFFAAISHELRTPLAAILAQADLILDPTYPLERRSRKEIGGSVKSSSEQLLSVVNDILEVARAESGRLDIVIEDVKLPDIVKELRHTLEGLAKGSQLRVAVDLPRDLPLVRADGSRVREIILNLVENAVKYTPPGGRIALSAVEQNGSVAVSVADTGVGIPEGTGEHVFEPFYRVPGAKTQGGQPSSGLGLAITKRLVEAHGGVIGFVSRLNEGTTFTFSLPRAKPRVARKTASRG